ncbi:MAG: PadR family transcriptional regulator [Ktedonobacterales bacterium]
MYELVILGFLMRRPYHGYLIAKIINEMIGPFARLSNGRLYPLLVKLEQEGMIAVATDSAPATAIASDRQHRTFEITEAGRQRFRELMLDTTSNPGEYQRIFWFKLPNLYWLDPTERLYLLDDYINFCQTHLFHLANESRDLERKGLDIYDMSAEQLEASLMAMRHLRDQWQLELESAHTWRAREVARMEGPGAAENTLVGESQAEELPSPSTATWQEQLDVGNHR